MKILIKRTWLIIVPTSLVFLLAFLFFFVPINLTQSSLSPLIKKIMPFPEQKPTVSESWLRLEIPKIKVDVALESVGLTAQGAVGVPKDLANAAWFNLGSHPVDEGSAIIIGHYGFWKNGTLGVFNNLNKLRPGDKLFVKDDQGVTTTFVVRELKLYNQNENVPDVFISHDGQAHLNLITCEGTWNKTSKSYPKRLVVFTDKE